MELTENKNQFDTVILSTHNKGAWLANELSDANQRVAILDLTSCLPSFNQEDIESPFGFFITDSMSESQQQWWKKRWSSSVYGFSVLNETGFLHFRKPFLSSVYQHRSDFQAVKDYFENRIIKNKSFYRYWLMILSRYMVSGVERPLSETFTSMLSLKKTHSLFEDFGTVSLQSPLLSLLHSDVDVFLHKKFNLSIQQKENNTYRLASDQWRIQTKRLVCFLNPEELRFIDINLFKFFFKKQMLKPIWCWRRFEFEFDFEAYPFPFHSVQASVRDLPWNHERLLCLKPSSVFLNRLNVWAKLPFEDEKTMDSLEWIHVLDQKLGVLFPHFKKHWRIEQTHTSSILFPIYEEKDYRKIKIPSKDPVWYAHNFSDVSWNGVAQIESQLRNTLLSL